MSPFLRALSALLLLGLWAMGCTTKETKPPAATGPSELGTSLSVSASPDTLNQDGASQSQITVLARDANGQPLAGLGMRLDVVLNGVPQDLGRLSSKSVTTGSDGRATAFYTAPAPVVGFTGQTTVGIAATPVGVNASSQIPRTVEIRLVPPGVIAPPGPPVPDFEISPETPVALQQVQFDASDEDLDAIITSYRWTFGDGGTGSGRSVAHQYRTSGSFAVTLTVTDAAGAPASRTKAVHVGEGTRPQANFAFSPADPEPGQDVFFNASTTTVGPGRHITRHEWDFGDGAKGSGVTVSHRYAAEGTYTVTLSVTDNAGLRSAFTRPVEVKVPTP